MTGAESGQLAACLGKAPLVTVAMPIYNAGKFLRLAVLSVIAQTYSDWELLIIDDGSTDNALADIADISDQRIHIICDGANRGLGARLNEAIDLARGKYFARMDQDDVSFPERFEFQVIKLESEPELELVAVRSIVISEKNEILGMLPFDFSKEHICKSPWRGFFLAHPTWMGKTDWFKKHRYASPAPYLCEDQELLLRTYESSNFDVVPLVLFAYRFRDVVVLKKLLKTRISVMRLQVKHFVTRRQFGFFALTLCVFIGRLIMDVLLISLNKRKIRQVVDSSDMFIRWNVILKRLNARNSEDV
jgi:glycosyltransferase involved in cell wall biosynthesis